jgi:beta-phosphoglucomutase-like phosphatase (HAD superfamily)
VTTVVKKPTLADLEQTAADLMQADLTAARTRARLYAMICDLDEQGERPMDVAAAAGVTRQRIDQVLRAAGRRGVPA